MFQFWQCSNAGAAAGLVACQRTGGGRDSLDTAVRLRIWGLGFKFQGYIGIMEKNMETTIMCYIGIIWVL